MKHILGCVALGFLIFSCKGPEADGYTINGTMSGDLPDSAKVYLRRSTPDLQPGETDSTAVNGGSFRFEGAIEEPRLYFLFVEGSRGAIPLILEEGEIEVVAHKDSLNAAVVSGSVQNETYAAFLDGARQLSERMGSINRDMQAAMASRDTANMNSLRDEYFELQKEGTEYEAEFARTHPDALISALLLRRMLETKAVPVSRIDSLYQGLTPEMRNTETASWLAEKLETAKKTAIGSKAPEFSAPTPDGKELALSEVLGKVTLVDFWAAWCRPCRAENPNIVRVYEKYKDKGLSILGVSLDRNASDWKKAIEEDGLAWHHVSNVDYFDEIAELYNVNAIPASFILDENGVIIAKDLRGPALEEKIAELLP